MTHPFLYYPLEYRFFSHQDVQTVAKPYGIHDSKREPVEVVIC